jgi:hypothetical protein
MKIITFFNLRLKLFTIWDVKLSQLSAVFLTVLIIKLFPEILRIPYWCFIIAIVICAIRPLYVMFLKKG